MNDISPLDTSVIETLKALMKDKFNFLIDTFLRNAATQLEQLETAISNNETKDIIALTHSIKGSSGSVGAIKMHILSKDYEEKARNGELDEKADWANLLRVEFKLYEEAIQSHLQTTT